MAVMFVNGSGRNEQSLQRAFPRLSYQVSVHLAKWFQRRKFLKIGDQKQEFPVAAMFVNGPGRYEHSS